MNNLHLSEINVNNPLGSKGVITIAFGNLIKYYYLCCIPWHLLEIFGIPKINTFHRRIL